MVISQSLLKPYMSAEERPFAIDSISEKEATQSSKGRLSYRCGASEGFKTFAVTFFEDFGVLCGQANEMSYDYSKVTKAGAHRSFPIRSLWASRVIRIHSLANT